MGTLTVRYFAGARAAAGRAEEAIPPGGHWTTSRPS